MKYPNLIIFKQKHGDRIFVANSDEDAAKIALKVFLERVEEDCWYYFDEDKPETPKMSLDDGVKLLNGSALEALKNQWKEYTYQLRSWEDSNSEKLMFDEIIKNNDGKLAWKFLRDRSYAGAEYETVNIDYPEKF